MVSLVQSPIAIDVSAFVEETRRVCKEAVCVTLVSQAY